MWFAKCFGKYLPSLGLCLSLAWLGVTGCTPRLAPLAPLAPPGTTMQPGRYLTAFYRAPDFAPDRVTYTIEPFTVEQVQGISPETFQTMLQDELTRAWQANGLKTAPRGDAVLAGTIQDVALHGLSLRFITGKISADLVVSGALTRRGETLFAFQDRIHLTSPLKPGPPAPKEAELMLHAAARTLAMHLLNELLLYGLPAEGK